MNNSTTLAEIQSKYQNCNLLIPAATSVQINPFYKCTVMEVVADTSEKSGDIFKVGSTKTGEDRNGKAIYKDVFSPAKPLLMKLATAAGIQFHPEHTTVYRENANTYVGKAFGAVRLPDGTFKTHPDTKRICLDDEEAKYRLEFMDKSIMGIHDWKAAKAAADMFNVYNIAEGAVRAGKTVDNVYAFAHELKTHPDKLHLATGSTGANAKLNIGDCNGMGLESIFRGQCKWGKYKGNECLIINGPDTGYREKVVIFAGAALASSFKKIRGNSYGMWIATEVNLHHDNTIKEAFNRTLASHNRKFFWDLNPDHPKAKIYTDYIDKYVAKHKTGELKGGVNYAICAFFSGAAEWFNTNVIQPIIGFFKGLWESVSGFFSDLWQDIQGIWKSVSEWFDTNVVEPVVGFFQGLHERVSQIFEGLWIIVQAIWKIVSEWFNTNVIQPVVGFFKGLWESVSGFFSSLWTDVQNVWKAVSGWFKANVTDPVTGFFKGVWTSVSGFFSDLWKGIQNVWKSVAGWFSRTVIDPIRNAWKTATDAVGGFFTGLWHGIANGVVSAMNSVIGSIESGINFIVGGINSILSGFNSVVSWAASIVGVDWSGVSLVPSVYLTRIPLPYLASGAVIPPNAPFAAVLGDQKRGRNLEAPESLIRKIVREESGKGAGSGNIYHVHVNVSGRELLEIVLDEGELKRGRNGGNPFMLGVT